MAARGESEGGHRALQFSLPPRLRVQNQSQKQQPGALVSKQAKSWQVASVKADDTTENYGSVLWEEGRWQRGSLDSLQRNLKLYLGSR